MNEERAHDAVQHLQAAAVELIAAARAALDVVEGALRDPSQFVHLLAAMQPQPPTAGPSPGDSGGDHSDDGDAHPASRVTRIPVR